jgi:hypothetical protein
MPYHLLRTYAVILTVLGWMHLIFFLALGFLPWYAFAGQAIPVGSPWEKWAIYLSPVGGLILGGFAALGYFVTSQLIRVFLDQRDFLEELLGVNRRLLRIVEGKRRGGGPLEADLFRLDQSLDDELPSL